MNRSFSSFVLGAALALGIAGGAQAQVQILSQGFEGSGSWAIESGAGSISADAGATNTPPNQRIRTGTASWQVINSSAGTSLVLTNTDVSGYNTRRIIARVSSISTTTGNGAETSDTISFYTALDGAAFSGTADIRLTGATASNSRWGYWATNTAITTAGVSVVIASAQGGLSSNNVAQIEIALPNSATTVAFKVTAVNNAAGEVWCVDDVELVGYSSGGVQVQAVSSLVATATSATNIDLSWSVNSSNDPVLVAWATNATFGNPVGAYSVSDPISGGGTVLYVGAATSVAHGVLQNKTYHYKAWSVRDTTNYSPGVSASATTPIAFPPSLAITNPVAASNYVLAAVTQYVVQGVATNLAGDMMYSNRATGVVAPFAAASNWSVTIDLAYGGNIIAINGTNADGIAATVATTLVYRANPPVIPSPTTPQVWINEFHYDNSGTDANEGVEIAGPAGTDLSAYSLVFYSGTSGYTYQTNVLTGTIDDESCGYGAVWFAIAGIQNGQTDGLSNADAILLVKDTTNVIHFISYEGTMQALNGPAEAYQSIDVGTSEDGTGAATISIQLGAGVGTNAAAFMWVGPAANSTGTLNSSQAQAITGCAGNQAPVLPAIGAKSVSAGSPLNFPVTAQDFIDGDTIVLYATNLPAGASFSPVTNATAVTNTFVWNSAGPAGTYTVHFFAGDKDGTNTEAVVITVTNPPAGTPVLTITNPAVSPFDVAYTSATFDVQGISTNLSGLIAWTNRGGAVAGAVTAAVDWAVAAIPLVPGTNTIILRATNVDGIAVGATTIVRRAGGFVSAPVWINEINYDPFGTDTNEFIEIAGPAGTDLSSYRLVLYNGSGSLSYLTTNLSGVIADQGCGYGAISFAFNTNGVQNGDPDGIALVATSSLGVVQYLSYDGVMGANDGPAYGLTATQILVWQTNSLHTIQLSGTGTTYGAFAWVTNAPSAGALNAGQSTCTGGGTDDDGDLLPNAWEALYFGGNTNATASDDSDVPPDGFSNLQEYIAGTNPTNANSFLKLDAIVSTNSANRTLSFQSVTGRVYAIDWIVDLTLGNWSNLQSGIGGTGSPIAIDDPSTDTNRAYRLGVKLQ